MFSIEHLHIFQTNDIIPPTPQSSRNFKIEEILHKIKGNPELAKTIESDVDKILYKLKETEL